VGHFCLGQAVHLLPSLCRLLLQGTANYRPCLEDLRSAEGVGIH
jgi:hypothetical protein